ncbi:MAG TPA: lipase family protein [Longimicrobium sp.]|nr:lipase family protein [Longimicrobium sp.]
MTLAGLAYAFPESLPKHLARPDIATGGKWSATWIPAERKGLFAYAAASADPKLYAVAIRGTNPSFTSGFLHNLLTNVTVDEADDWKQDPVGAGARIARGAKEAVDVLTTITDAKGETLVAHLRRTVPDGATVLVTGHSLGGCLASVLALYLARESAGRFRVKPITFAAPTAGDRGFAELYQVTFPDAERYFNHLDLVPRAWHGVGEFGELYAAPGPRCPPDFRVFSRLASDRVGRHAYTQPGAGIPLGDETVRYPGGGGLLARLGRLLRRKVFFLEALHHHMPDRYLENLGAPKLPFRLPLPWLYRNVTRRLKAILP